MKNIPSKNSGDLLTAEEWNSPSFELQNFVTSAGISLSGADLEQVGKSVAAYATVGNYCTDSGTINNYVLSVASPRKAPVQFYDGMLLRFRAGNSNTGTSQVNAYAFGNKPIKKAQGADDLKGGDIISGHEITISYDTSSGGFFELISTPKQDTIIPFAVTTGAANIYVATFSPPFGGLEEGDTILVVFNITNTGPSTLAVDGLGTKPIKGRDGEILTANELTPIFYLLTYTTFGGGEWLIANEHKASQVLVDIGISESTYITPKTLQGKIGKDAFTTGDVKLTYKTSQTGWVLMDDKSIGNGSSGATGRANADTENLFVLLWDNVADAYAPVSTGRGASAIADFNANKTLTLPRTLGMAFGGAGAGSGLTSRGLGEWLTPSTTPKGEETHILTKAEIPTHVHTYEEAGGLEPQSGIATNCLTTLSTQNTGNGSADGLAGNAHNNMQPTSFLNALIKL